MSENYKVEFLNIEMKKPGSGSRAGVLLIHNGKSFYLVNMTSQASRFGKCALHKTRAETVSHINNILNRAAQRGLTGVNMTSGVTETNRDTILEISRSMVDSYDTNLVDDFVAKLKSQAIGEIPHFADFDHLLKSKATLEREALEEKMGWEELPEVTVTIAIDEGASIPKNIPKEPEKAKAPSEDELEMARLREAAGYGSW
jgi:hypothetical protein